MEKPVDNDLLSCTENTNKNKIKPRGKKRKRIDSDSSSETGDVLPENALEVENNLIASAVKNNLDDVCVKKILKKVVTNDHVLALVKLREEEENSSMESSGVRPKLTRAKAKELKKPWNLENLELTPIKHIPVKTRPEVKALIAQELPEDEDDEEYEPTHDDVPSDDDQGLESCSDIDSQPRTPATPRSLSKSSPRLVKDGPFKVPVDVSTPTRRKLKLDEEEATIALRTRSKLCLSETPIEHIESSFVPPDDLPVPPVDDHLWNEFLTDCMNPTSVSKNEDDDETDPEYNVAADPDAHDEDEEALDSSIIKISKKELNDLVTELFNIMPEASVDDELANIATSVLTDDTKNGTSNCWEGKQEPLSDEEPQLRICEGLSVERRDSFNKVSIGKSEPMDEDPLVIPKAEGTDKQSSIRQKTNDEESNQPLIVYTPCTVVRMAVQETVMGAQPPPEPAQVPPLVLQIRHEPRKSGSLTVTVPKEPVILPEQVLILQQQLRQHVQLSTSNFLQLFVNPLHWAIAPVYKDYLESLSRMVEVNPSSVAGVCNLKAAMELVKNWEETVSKDTPENTAMVEFIQKEAERWRRSTANNRLYTGEFPEKFKKVVANSTVFLYPYLLPPLPYGADSKRKYSYLRSEDELIALGLDQFWPYVDNNPGIFKRKQNSHPRHRWGLAVTVELMIKHMFPWLTSRIIRQRITSARSHADPDNPIYKFLTTGEVTPVKHKLIPFNPKMTLYEQPEIEMPRCWLRHLGKTSKRFKVFLTRRHNHTGSAPEGVEIDVNSLIEPPPKEPLHIDFTKEIKMSRPDPTLADPHGYDVIPEETQTAQNLYQLVQTSEGAALVPVVVKSDVDKITINLNSKIAEQTNTVTCNDVPISSAVEAKTISKLINGVAIEIVGTEHHCCCCIMLRQICKTKQTVITDYFRSKNINENKSKSSDNCQCNKSRYPAVTKKLRLLIKRYKFNSKCIYEDILKKLKVRKTAEDRYLDGAIEPYSMEDLAYVAEFQQKLTIRVQLARNIQIKYRVYNLLSNFDLDWDDPIKLALELDQVFNIDLVDVFKEFVGFLNPEQADKIGRFRDYFIHNCAGDLVRKIEEHVKDETTKESLLKQISMVFTARDCTPCSFCSGLLMLMRPYPQLAEYTFSLFPHARRHNRPKDEKVDSNLNAAPSSQANSQKTSNAEHPATEPLAKTDDARSGEEYEADHSSSSEENDGDTTVVPLDQCPTDDSILDQEKKEAPTIIKTEAPMSDEFVTSEEEFVKSEPAEWKRDEDKLILEMLKEHLTPEERKDKTILEIIEEKQIVQILMQSLTEKSFNDIKERMIVILNLLVLGKL
ncbi:unnamed protein product [Chilo suppressalis]|uniref:DUF4211 domain-containing protein n=1 Tax=Chilo suppressalis TaxID=168631 RepID=A0ABN8AYF6_CHISP|nr:unnamed protein product [Chilo suppressalis]